MICLNGGVVERNARKLVSWLNIKIKIDRTAGGLNRLFVLGRSMLAAVVGNHHSLRIKVRHHLMVTRADEVYEGHFNVVFCTAYSNSVGVLGEAFLPMSLVKGVPPVTFYPIPRLNASQDNFDDKPIIEISRSRIALIIRTRQRDGLIFNLKRIQIPVCTRLSSNRLDGEGQILPNINAGLVRQLVVINHSMGISAAIVFTSPADFIRNSEVVRRVRRIRNLNRRIVHHAVQRIHAVVPSQLRAVG